ncbi:Elongator complex protein 1 [Quillaja saponaria]|uniref:Elongator complex protein 1 n=1 Tax=Quillaja saponaria TaxID=32244 RepID=A0AAD7PY19_QUISA|nr:Elongator complex protein 1 [Quillaja saponaria]
MKNLKLYSELSLNLEFQSKNEVLQFSAFDIERNRLFFVSSHNFIYTSHLSSFHDEGSCRNFLLSTEVDTIDLNPGDCITSFDYLMEKEALIVGTSDGLLLLHNVEDNTTEIVGKVEGGVKCISPSPDGELLGVITGFGQILVMTHDWDLLFENALEDLPEDSSVRETEFSSGFEDPISWQGDGKYFATLNDVCNSTSPLKKLKIWERNSGVLHASSESKAFGAVLDWMPSGAKIAAVYDRKTENKCPVIVFFERNGLERSTFSINEGIDATMKTLKWNCSSDLLAGVVRCENYDSLKFWSFSNNHWYLKHEIRYTKLDEVRFIWNPTRPLQLVCWTLGGQITVYNFIWNTAVMEDSTALVIDDSNIFVTPLTLSLMPPPMYLFSLKFSSAVRDIALYSKNSKNHLAASLSDGCLCIVELPAPETWEELEGKEFYVEACSIQTVFGSIIHLSWLDSHILLAVSHYGFSHSNYVSQSLVSYDGLLGFYSQEFELECSEDQVPGLLTCSGWHAKVSNRSSLPGLVVGIASNPVSKCAAYIQFSGGKIVEYKSKIGIGTISLQQEDKSFSSTYPWMRVVSVGSSGPLKPMVFGLDDIGRLQVKWENNMQQLQQFLILFKLG